MLKLIIVILTVTWGVCYLADMPIAGQRGGHKSAHGAVLAGGCGVAWVSARDAADEAALMLGGNIDAFEAGAQYAEDNDCIKVMPKLRRKS